MPAEPCHSRLDLCGFCLYARRTCPKSTESALRGTSRRGTIIDITRKGVCHTHGRLLQGQEATLSSSKNIVKRDTVPLQVYPPHGLFLLT